MMDHKMIHRNLELISCIWGFVSMLLFFAAMIVSEKTETQTKQIIVFLSLYVLYALFTFLYPVIVRKIQRRHQ